MAKKLLLDMDTGCDDAIAILLAARSPELDLLGIGSVFRYGNALTAALNSLRALEAANRDDVPVAVGCDAALCQPPMGTTAVHGEDGLGNTHLPLPRRRPTDEHAVDQIIRQCRRHPGEVTLVATGPLTNVAVALRLEPRLSELAAGIVIMGGSARVGGNRTPWAEANIAYDPEAAATVFGAPWSLLMVGLDVTMAAMITADDYDAWGRSAAPTAQFAHRIYAHYLTYHERLFGRRMAPVHDALTVATLIDPSLIDAPILPVNIEISGSFTRGMTVVDVRYAREPGRPIERPSNIRVALTVKGQQFTRLLTDRLTTAL